MLSSVPRSERAIQVNIAIMRAFAQFRNILLNHADLAQKLAELESRIGEHDETIREILAAIHELLGAESSRRKERIGFHPRI